MELPKDFCTLMRQQYGDEMAESLFEGLSQEPSVSIRLNPKKSSRIVPTADESSILNSQLSICDKAAGCPNDLEQVPYCTDDLKQVPWCPDDLEQVPWCPNDLEQVPWCPGAYYLPERPAFTFDPLFHAGVYYVQEASSMYLAEVVRKHFLSQHPNPAYTNPIYPNPAYPNPVYPNPIFPNPVYPNPLCALDLCAAPGGKSTLLRSLLPDDCLLVCNEPIAKRTNILAENMQKWGYPNTIVSQNYPHEFVAFPHTFDLIVTDVPCSGEGMFRKDEGAINDWSLENVELCWRRQREILTAIWPCLKEGGMLVYSTCTFNHFEDEDNARWIAETLGAELLEERHFFPGKDRGEGFYIAALRKKNATEETQPNNTANGITVGETDSTSEHSAASKSTNIVCKKEREKQLATLKRKFAHGLRCLVNGIPAPTQKGKDLIPSHALALSTDYVPGTYPTCELSYNDAIAYLRHEVLRIVAPKGIVLVTFQGIPLGFVKNIGNRANNLYPQEWRIRTTHTTPFTLLKL